MQLLYFLLGIVFIHYAIPLLDSTLALLLMFIDMCNTKLKAIINKDNIKMKQAANAADDEAYPKTRPIGFTTKHENEKET